MGRLVIDTPKAVRLLTTLAIGTVGGAVAAFFGLPAGWLLGAAITVTLASLAGFDTSIPPRLRDLAFVVIGLSMGSGVSSETVAESARWPLSLVAVLVCLYATIAAAFLVLRRQHGFDRGTALLTAVPGALSYTVALALEGYGDPRKVALAQSIRLVVLVTMVPLFVDLVSTVGSVAAIAPLDLLPLAVVVAGGFGAGILCARLAVPSPYLIGGTLFSVGAHLSGLVSGGLPVWLIAPGFLVTGCLTGSRFTGIAMAELRNALSAGLVVVIVASLISAAFAVGVAVLLGLPFGQVWVAFAPGGVEAMVAISLSLDLDPTYVAAHHVLRFIAISLTVPLIIGLMKLEKIEA